MLHKCLIIEFFYRNAKRKKIEEMTEREKRSKRKYWRKLDSKRRQKKLANEQLPLTPPEDHNSFDNRSSGNKTRGRKVILSDVSQVQMCKGQ